MENVLSFVMRDPLVLTANGGIRNIVLTKKDIGLHRVNFTIVSFEMQRSPIAKRFSGRFEITADQLANGKYTGIVEFSPENNFNTYLSVLANPLDIDISHQEVNGLRLLFRFEKKKNRGKIKVDFRFDSASSNQWLGSNYAIIYGVDGWHSSVNASVYDHFCLVSRV